MREKKQKHLNGPPPKFVSRLHSQLSDKKGCIAAVESETGKYVLGDTLLETAKKARSAFPNKVFYFIRIGYPYVHRQIGGLKKIK
jgi:hypothetical protein